MKKLLKIRIASSLVCMPNDFVKMLSIRVKNFLNDSSPFENRNMKSRSTALRIMLSRYSTISERLRSTSFYILVTTCTDPSR